MPSKSSPGDWDRLFAPNAPRRGGPLRALFNTLITFVVLTLAGAAIVYGLRVREQRYLNAVATATVSAATAYPQLTATALARATSEAQATAAADAQATATALAGQPTPEPMLGVGTVLRGGNLRSEPRVADDTLIGLIWPGDEIAFLEFQEAGGQPWYRIRLTREAADRAGPGVAAGTVGWASATLLSELAPVPTAAP